METRKEGVPRRHGVQKCYIDINIERKECVSRSKERRLTSEASIMCAAFQLKSPASLGKEYDQHSVKDRVGQRVEVSTISIGLPGGQMTSDSWVIHTFHAQHAKRFCKIRVSEQTAYPSVEITCCQLHVKRVSLCLDWAGG
jgi:hypothetical protein